MLSMKSAARNESGFKIYATDASRQKAYWTPQLKTCVTAEFQTVMLVTFVD